MRNSRRSLPYTRSSYLFIWSLEIYLKKDRYSRDDSNVNIPERIQDGLIANYVLFYVSSILFKSLKYIYLCLFFLRRIKKRIGDDTSQRERYVFPRFTSVLRSFLSFPLSPLASPVSLPPLHQHYHWTPPPIHVIFFSVMVSLRPSFSIPLWIFIADGVGRVNYTVKPTTLSVSIDLESIIRVESLLRLRSIIYGLIKSNYSSIASYIEDA